MSGKNTAVFGLYPDETELVEAIEQLKRAGFRETDLSILVPENPGSKDIGHEKHTKAPEGAVMGGIFGVVIGGVAGWLTSTGVIVPLIPGADTLIVAVLAGMGALGTVGAIIGALAGGCTPEYEAKRYEGRTRFGGVLLSVHCDNAEWTSKAKNALRATGARSIASAPESKADYGRSEKPQPRAQGNELFTHRRFLANGRSNSLAEESLSSEPALVEMHQTDRRPVD